MKSDNDNCKNKNSFVNCLLDHRFKGKKIELRKIKNLEKKLNISKKSLNSENRDLQTEVSRGFYRNYNSAADKSSNDENK